MKFLSWNVNGLRACLNKGFLDFFWDQQADIFCVQETKMQEGQADLSLEGYQMYWNSAQKKGYSGTAVFTKVPPIAAWNDMPGQEELSGEGRVITLEFDSFYLVNVYTPNSQRELARLPFRMEWEDAFRRYLLELDAQKPVITCGDFNVVHQEIDLKNPKTNQKNAGFTPQEREKFSTLLESGFIDTFRLLYPDQTGAYTWWSYMFQARAKNAGWRIDYFLTSQRLGKAVEQATIYSDVLGSDHCPIGLEIIVPSSSK